MGKNEELELQGLERQVEALERDLTRLKSQVGDIQKDMAARRGPPLAERMTAYFDQWVT